jgi:hypothetical protein
MNPLLDPIPEELLLLKLEAQRRLVEALHQACVDDRLIEHTRRALESSRTLLHRVDSSTFPRSVPSVPSGG